jgi:Na+/proline symporter
VLVTVAIGLYGSEENIVKVALSVLTYFYDGLIGAFLLGIFTRRGTSGTVVAGMLISIPVVAALQLRQYVADPKLAPRSLRGVIESLPESAAAGITAWVPDVTWHYWLLPAIAVAMGVGALGTKTPEAA